ncbi:MAG: hypothetical protein U1E25_09265 [Methylocystis sp.]
MSLGEGAAVFILETEEAARARGHEPLCTNWLRHDQRRQGPCAPDLEGASNSIVLALEDAEMAPQEIHYVNAHGTATHANDITEAEAILRVFGDYGQAVPVSSTKPIHGHALGASGSLELVITIQALREQIAPPTINFVERDPKCPLDVVPNVARKHKIDAAMSNSFAFRRINAVLIVRHAA